VSDESQPLPSESQASRPKSQPAGGPGWLREILETLLPAAFIAIKTIIGRAWLFSWPLSELKVIR